MSFLSTLGNFVSEFARFILFFVSLTFLVGSSALLWTTTIAKSKLDIELVNIQRVHTILTVAVGFSIYLIVVSIIGVFASFYSSKSSIKLLALMTILNVCMGMAVFVSSSPKDGLSYVEKDLVGKLREYQSKYDWLHSNSSSSDVKSATSVWDYIQGNLGCCGIDNFKEWYSFRPKGHQDDPILPRSCCGYDDDANKPEAFCNIENHKPFEGGCTEELESIFVIIMDMLVFIVCFNAVIASLAFIVLCCNHQSGHNYDGSARYY